jgi:hypothetical protein
MSSTINTRVELDHPYWVAGLIAVLASFGILAFSLGVLSRCGRGSGLCFDTAAHASGDAGLIVFVVVLILGVALMLNTGSTAVTTRTKNPDPPAAVVTNIYTPAPAPAANVTNVYPETPATPPTTVAATSPR